MENPQVFLENSYLKKKKKRTVFFLFLICSTLLFSNADAISIPESDIEDTLIVITYNIHHGRGTDGEVDIDRIADLLIESKADIVALQEVDIHTERSGKIDIAKILSEKTGLKFTAFGKNLEFEGGEYGNAILSRYPIENEENIHFKNISGEQRGVQAAIIKIYQKSLLFLNTHLDHTENDDSERVLYAEKIRDEIIPFYDQQSIILAGDLNDVPGSETYQIINRHLKDAWIEAGTGEGFTIPVQNPNRRIDYIFYTGNIMPKEAKVIQTGASDHLPLVVKFMFTND